LFAQLVSKIFNLCGHDPPILQTDGQMTCDLKTALCTVVHRAVKTVPHFFNWFFSLLFVPTVNYNATAGFT